MVQGQKQIAPLAFAVDTMSLIRQAQMLAYSQLPSMARINAIPRTISVLQHYKPWDPLLGLIRLSSLRGRFILAIL
jgi:hypothetical protein